MEWELTTAGMLNAAGALLFVLLGLAALALARGSRRAILLGVSTLAFGAPLVFVNLTKSPPGPEWVARMLGLTAAYLLAAIPALLLALHLLHGLSRRARAAFGAGALLVLAGAAVSIAIRFARPEVFLPGEDPRLGFSPALIGFRILLCAWALVAFAAALRFRENEDARERRALAYLAAGGGIFAMFYLSPVSPTWAPFPIVEVPSWATAVGAPVAGWLAATRAQDRHVARNALLALLAAALLGVVFFRVAVPAFGTGFSDLGIPGVVRTIGALILALGILRHDLMRAPLPAWTTRRGPLAAGALVAVLVTAQIAQNFLSAQYGLLMGGLVAGALLVAARPIERALDGRREDPSGGRVSAVPNERAKRAYRDAVRHALRDRVMTRAEEVHLTILAEELHIAASEALAIRHEVEDELRERAR